ncbi:MAG: heparan-alpha-glucosaminide N-acetyltransferase domain-containing protein [Acidobacteriota bacterium]|nr:heparan-alpha-glucosaminide N-acetyltransferase domain-containing protein [Acidobacteriota bacterium]
MAINEAAAAEIKGRLFSLDFFRGLTMFLLIGESTEIYRRLVDPALQGTFLFALGTQFDHHPWAGLRFWDLVQPFFMFIVGVAMALSTAKRERRGDSRALITRHTVKRAFLLLLIGWALYCIEPGRITFRFQNVLAQLAVTTIVAYFLMRKPAKVQIAWSFVFILATEVIYRIFWVPGYNQPFVPDHNFGAWVDRLISGELSAGHWVSFNALPTIAHTVWGVLAGQWLMSGRPVRCKVRRLAIFGLALVGIGFALTAVTPMIKRICTSSFVIASGGFCLLMMALCYWAFDIKKVRQGIVFFNIVGMNCLAIYIFTQTGATEWLKHLVKPFTNLLLGWAGKLPAEILASLAAWALLWSICLWLYRKKILIKI